jgi:hypothetical protein
MKIFAVLACVLLSGSMSVRAQASGTHAAPVAQSPAAAPPSSPKVDPQKEADIRHLLELIGAENLRNQTARHMEKTMRTLLMNAFPPGAYRDELVDLFIRKFRSNLDSQSFAALAVPIYEQNFSDKDIRGLINFYETPLGQKYAATLPKLSAEILTAANEQGRKLGRESMLEVFAEHPDLKKALEKAQEAAHQRRR